MEPVTGAMGSLVLKFGALLQGEYNLMKDVRAQVMSLSRELESMHAALLKVAELPREQLDPQVRLWARDVREASYDMEDVLDAFLVRVEGSAASQPADTERIKHFWAKIVKPFSMVKARYEIAGVIKIVKKQLEEMSERRRRYKLDEPAVTVTVDPRLLSMYKDVTQLVGIEGPRDELIKMLSLRGDNIDTRMSRENKMKVVSVVGFGGLGKTTLVKAVYDKFKLGFDCSAFVPVGRNPDVKKVLMDVLIGVDKKNYMNSNMMMCNEKILIDELRDVLQKKRYFIVIDDIWDKKSWDLIRCALLDSNCGSRVVTTTRIDQVARHAGDVYKLRTLSHHESEKLLYARIGDGEGKCIGIQPVEAGEKILKKCGGVPLAIITIASLLANRPTWEDWSEVYNSIGFGHGGNDDVDNTRRILSLSYHDLPQHLKTCLLYLSIYPEDYEIKKDDLIWKWIAEGFVHEECGIGLFELAERYFNELINTSLIQPTEDEDKGHIYGCRIHDMVFDLVCSLSREENFVTMLTRNGQKEFPHSKARRLALQLRTIDFNKKRGRSIEEHNLDLATMGMEKVRSLIASHCSIGVVSPPCFRVLRVLDLEGCNFMEDYRRKSLEYLSKLLYLRYLGLRDTRIRELPEKIGQHLKFLLTLDLVGTFIEQLPSSVGLLTQLLCLRTANCTKGPEWIGKLTSLQELWIYPEAKETATWWFVKELGNLSELRVLRIHIYTGELTKLQERDQLVSALLLSLHNLCKIRHLDLLGRAMYNGKGAIWEEGFVCSRHLRHLWLGSLEFCTLPGWISSSLLPNLSFLSVRVHVVREKDMETLARLPNLCSLILDSHYTQMVSMKNTGGQQEDYFRKLRLLTVISSSIQFDLQDCEILNLEALEFTVGVRYVECANQLSFDNLGLEKLPSLQMVKANIDCSMNAHAAAVEEVEAALRRAATVHPNVPTLKLIRHFESSMRSTQDESLNRYYTRKVIDLELNVCCLEEQAGYVHFLLLLQYPCVEKVTVSINCENAMLWEVEEAEADARYATDLHPNHPILEITRYSQDKMVQAYPADETNIPNVTTGEERYKKFNRLSGLLSDLNDVAAMWL